MNPQKEKFSFDQYWFLPRKSIFGNFSGIPLKPSAWEGYVTYIILIIASILFFILLDVISLKLQNIISFIITLIILILLFIVISKNTVKEVIENPKSILEEFNQPIKKTTPKRNKRLPQRINSSELKKRKI